MEDVAAEAGVSRALVSIVFRNQPGAGPETRSRVLAVANRLGYRPDHRAQLLGRKRTGLIGVVFSLRHTFHGDLVESLYAAAEPVGFEVALSAVVPNRDERTAIEALQSYRCEALVLLGPELVEEELLALARAMPVVAVARSLSRSALALNQLDVVRSDDTHGAMAAVNHLRSLDHTDIWHVDGGRAPGATERRRGYRTAMRLAGLSTRVLPGGLTEERGAAAAKKLLAEPHQPSAVTVFNDRSAVGLIDTLRRAGAHAPQDLSVIGYDDDHVARLPSVDLSTMRQDTTKLAAAAMEQALDRLNGKPCRETVIPPTLIVRRTTSRFRSRQGHDRPK
jgi:DNA-binding LacI/PurR family transcriptional regulator